MTDFINRVREQAEREAERIWPKPSVGSPWTQEASRGCFRDGYVRGQVDLASRMTREKIAEVLAYQECKRVNPKADDPIQGFYAFSEDQREWLIEQQLVPADAVLALMVEGEA